jgi:hypothetical protein
MNVGIGEVVLLLKKMLIKDWTCTWSASETKWTAMMRVK